MKDDAIRRRHFQDSLLPRGLPTKELANRLLVRVPSRVRERVRARARGGQVFVRFAINIKQDGDQEPYEYNSGHLRPSPSARRMGAEARRCNNWDDCYAEDRRKHGDDFWATSFFSGSLENYVFALEKIASSQISITLQGSKVLQLKDIQNVIKWNSHFYSSI